MCGYAWDILCAQQCKTVRKKKAFLRALNTVWLPKYLLTLICCNCWVGHHWVRRGTAASLTQRYWSSCQECSCRRANILEGGWLVSWIHNLKKKCGSCNVYLCLLSKKTRPTALTMCKSKSCKLQNVTWLSRPFVKCFLLVSFLCLYTVELS